MNTVYFGAARCIRCHVTKSATLNLPRHTLFHRTYHKDGASISLSPSTPRHLQHDHLGSSKLGITHVENNPARTKIRKITSMNILLTKIYRRNILTAFDPRLRFQPLGDSTLNLATCTGINFAHRLKPLQSRIIHTTSQTNNVSATQPSHSEINHSGSDNKDQDSKQKSGRFSNWTGKNSWKAGLLSMALMFGSMGATVIYSWGAPERDQDGEVIKDQYIDKPVYIAYSLRAWDAVKDFSQMVRDPTSEKLLPDPLVYPYVQPPYTLVLELSGLLLKPEWDLKMGWRFKKRPGLDYFLQTCAQSGYEIVIFSVESASVGYPLTISMDPQNFIWYRLFKEDTRYTSGVHIKDLNCLNRDLAKVILIDVDKQAFKLNPRNGIAVTKWSGDDSDRELYDLAALLQTVASKGVEDIRSVAQHYNQFDDPMAKFRENQAAVLQAHEEMMRLQTEDNKKHITPSPFISPNLRR